jgi:uncharacterized lipoprotein YddW (UPF0748 family)
MRIMKKLYLFLTFLCVCISSVLAQSPKREMRATWIATVGGIDWPKTTSAAAQKTEMLRMLDSISALNLNAVFFQVRSRCDAMYNSAYEPWSSDLKISRGATPSYDPLAFVLDECHKRGLECHAWLNPYRYNNTGNSWSGANNSPLNYENTHPDWLLWYSSNVVLDPALPEVRRQIKSVVGDIISKYDLDGIVFDDYFYPYGGTTNQDAASQSQYFSAWSEARPGKTVHDWRRDNVNRMIADVYDTIQAINPSITFGVSPFGIWTTSSSVAAAEGITLPSGITGGNMYQEIYCDPVAWLKEGTVDYISPQLYWKTGGGQDYNKLCPWWADLANRFGKQFYSSMAIYKYSEGTDAAYTVTELKNQTLKNRSSSNDNAPGSVFYNTGGWVFDAPFRNEFRANVFQRPALTPAIHWKPAPEQEPVSFTGPPQGSVISWTHNTDENVRYAVYAVPTAKRNDPNVFSKSENLVAITCNRQFTMRAGAATSTHKIAVSVIDRYGNEYAPRVFGETVAAPVTATLTSPADNAAIGKATLFQWQGDASVDCYIWQLSRNPQFTDLVASMETTDTKFNSGLVTSIADDAAYWWRVKTRKANASDTWSEARRFTIGNAGIFDSPKADADEMQAYAYKEYGSYYLNIRSSEELNARLDIYSASGQRVASKPVYLAAGDNRIPLSLSGNSGMFIAKIQTNKKQLTVKIVN